MKTLHVIHFVTLLASLAGADPKHQWKFEWAKPVQVEAPPPPIQTAPPVEADEPSPLQEKLTRKLMAEQVNSLKRDFDEKLSQGFEALAQRLAAELKPPQLPPVFDPRQVPEPTEAPAPEPPVTNMPAKVQRPAQRSPSDWLDSLLEIDEDAPRMMAHEKIKFRTLCPAWCKMCKPVLKRMGEHPNYEFDCVDEEEPGQKYYPAVIDPVTGIIFSNTDLESWDKLLRCMNAHRFDEDKPKLMTRMPPIPSGLKIPPRYLEYLPQFQEFSPNGSILLKNKLFHYVKGWTWADVAAETRLDWTTKDGVTTATLTPSPVIGVGSGMASIRAGILSVDVSLDGAVLHGRRVSISVPAKD